MNELGLVVESAGELPQPLQLLFDLYIVEAILPRGGEPVGSPRKLIVPVVVKLDPMAPVTTVQELDLDVPVGIRSPGLETALFQLQNLLQGRLGTREEELLHAAAASIVISFGNDLDVADKSFASLHDPYFPTEK